MIDAGLGAEWDPRVVEAASQFDQGHLVTQPPFFYAAVPGNGVWETTKLVADEFAEGEDGVIEVDPHDRPPYGILTSQGCDVADSQRKPWVQIAPVYPADEEAVGEERLAAIRRDAVPHLVLLDPPALEGTWIADLRIEVPVEKSWLVGREPIAGFSDTEGRRRFALRLSGRLERPALPDAVHAALVRPLRRLIDNLGKQKQAEMGTSGVEFRLLCHSAADNTHECRLLAIGRRAPLPESLTSWLDGVTVRLSGQDQESVVFLGCRACTSDSVSMREYLASVLLDDRFLGPDADVA
jgi:hypothetical protein